MPHARWLVGGVLLCAVAACGQRAPGIADLDLGGGISMTANGEIKGATPPWLSGVPPEEGDVVAGSSVQTTLDVIADSRPVALKDTSKEASK
jgi:hypothetical protein